jgi:hypothetical protein
MQRPKTPIPKGAEATMKLKIKINRGNYLLSLNGFVASYSSSCRA